MREGTTLLKKLLPLERSLERYVKPKLRPSFYHHSWKILKMPNVIFCYSLARMTFSERHWDIS